MGQTLTTGRISVLHYMYAGQARARVDFGHEVGTVMHDNAGVQKSAERGSKTVHAHMTASETCSS